MSTYLKKTNCNNVQPPGPPVLNLLLVPHITVKSSLREIVKSLLTYVNFVFGICLYKRKSCVKRFSKTVCISLKILPSHHKVEVFILQPLQIYNAAWQHATCNLAEITRETKTCSQKCNSKVAYTYN